jgi:hypothetical protein
MYRLELVFKLALYLRWSKADKKERNWNHVEVNVRTQTRLGYSRQIPIAYPTYNKLDWTVSLQVTSPGSHSEQLRRS